MGWIAAAVVSITVLPSLERGGSGGLDGFIPEDAPPVGTEIRSFADFGFPLYSRTIVVQHDPEGLSGWSQAQAIALAVALSRQEYDDVGPVLGALPLPNALPGVPTSSKAGTTVLTFVFMPPWTGFDDQLDAARTLGERFLTPRDAFAGVTGTIPARAEQARLISESLHGVEIATLIAIVVIVAVTFRSVVAPVLALAINGVAFVVTINLAGYIGYLLGVAVPDELRPLLVALQIGVVTDYLIFFLSGLRRRVRLDEPRLRAAQNATAEFAHIVLVAGITVAAGTAALLVARSELFQAFGPGMILAILISLVVALTLIPASLAIGGRWLFWPSPGRAVQEPRPSPAWQRIIARPFSAEAVRSLTRRRTAALVAGCCILGLGVLALPVTHMGLSMSFIPSLPSDNPVRQAGAAAQEGFVAGITSPTEVLIEGPDVTTQRQQLNELQALIDDRDGVAGVIGPAQVIAPTEIGVFLSQDQDAARFLIVLADEPLGANSVDTLVALREDLPALVEQVGMTDVTYLGIAGDTAIAETIITATENDLVRIALAALAINLFMLVVFLRALVAPLYLLASSVLALLATLGLTTFVFQDLGGQDGLTFYVPFAAAVLLVSLGSDYNIFGVGHIWSEARHRPLPEALVVALPQTTQAITTAGVTLAVSFGLLALVPLTPFRELAFAMFVGILIDAVVVRSFLVPALLTLVGRRSAWPGGQLHHEPDEVATPEPVQA